MSAKKRCGAKTREGTPCQLVAGHGTSHPGFGRCKYHGGSTPTGQQHAAAEAAKSQTHELIDEIKDLEFREAVRRAAARGDVTELFEELAIVRAYLMKYLNEAAEHENALLRWSASWDQDWQAKTRWLVQELEVAKLEEDWPRYGELLQQLEDPLAYMNRPRKLVEPVSVISTVVEKIAKLSQILYDRIADGSVPASDVEYLMGRIADEIDGTLRVHVPDISHRVAIQAELERRFAALRLPSWEESGREDVGGHLPN